MPLFDDLPDYPDVDQPSCQLLGRTALVRYPVTSRDCYC